MNSSSELERSLLNRIVQTIAPDTAAIVDKTGRRAIVSDGFEDEEPSWSVLNRVVETGDPVSETNLSRSILAVPYKDGTDEIQGIMYVELYSPRRLKHRDLAILQELRRRAENKFLPGRRGRKGHRMQRLLEAKRSAISTLNIVTRVLKPERAIVLVEVEDNSQLLASHGLPNEDSLEGSDISGKLLEALWEEGEPLFIADVQKELELDELPEVREYRIRSVAAAPLLDDEGQCRGLVYLDSRNVPSRFLSPQLAILTRFVDSLRNELSWLLNGEAEPPPDKGARKLEKRKLTALPPLTRDEPVDQEESSFDDFLESESQASSSLEAEDDDVITVERSIELEDEPSEISLEDVPEATLEDEIPAVVEPVEASEEDELEDLRREPSEATIEVAPERAELLRRLAKENLEPDEVLRELMTAEQEQAEPEKSEESSFPTSLEALIESQFSEGTESVETLSPHETITVELECEPGDPESLFVMEPGLEYIEESVEELPSEPEALFGEPVEEAEPEPEVLEEPEQAEPEDLEVEPEPSVEFAPEFEESLEELPSEPEALFGEPIEEAELEPEPEVLEEPEQVEPEDPEEEPEPSVEFAPEFEESLEELPSEPEALFGEPVEEAEPEPEVLEEPEQAEPEDPEEEPEPSVEFAPEFEESLEELPSEPEALFDEPVEEAVPEPEVVEEPEQAEPEDLEEEPEPSVEFAPEFEESLEELPSEPVEDDFGFPQAPDHHEQPPFAKTIEVVEFPIPDPPSEQAPESQEGPTEQEELAPESSEFPAPRALTRYPDSSAVVASTPKKEPSFWKRLWLALWPWAKREASEELQLLTVRGRVVVEEFENSEELTRVTLRFAEPRMSVTLELSGAEAEYVYHGAFPGEEPPVFNLVVERSGYAPVKLSKVSVVSDQGDHIAEVSEITLLPR